MQMRIERDMLGEHHVPADAYWGVHTSRAVENFPVSGIPIGHYSDFVIALVLVKQAAAMANQKLGHLESEKADAIVSACKRITQGELHNQFVVDVIQGGAGTSTNMNTNEVVANLALEIMGKPKGSYDFLHPIDDVNMSQSTNDAYPTAMRLAILINRQALVAALDLLIKSLRDKSIEFSEVLKLGRTQLQDAVPMTLGQEFGAFSTTLEYEIDRINELSVLFEKVNLGATAIGTGINSDPDYSNISIKILADISGFNLSPASNMIEATSDTGSFVLFSSTLKRLAIKLSKICNDLRLLSSGPRAGFGEINLPAVQAGSSMMPGKVNPVIPEVVNQIAFQVIGDDLSVTMAAQAGQLQLNAMEPLIAYKILNSIRTLTSGIDILRTRCIEGITANVERCRDTAMNSLGLITALTTVIGHERAAELVKEAQRDNRNVIELLLEKKFVSDKHLNELLKPENLTRPQRLAEIITHE
jgi:aspartate ammonia-lyase